MTTATGKNVRATPEGIPLWGGALCLDFANTVDWSADDRPLGPDTDALNTPAELARWARRLGIGSPAANAEELAATRELRDAVYATFSAIARAAAPPPATLELLTRTHARAAAEGRLAPREGAYRLEWPARDPRRVRFAVAVDAIELLRDPERLRRVRRCPGRDCGWLFLDVSGRRRWCSMSTCGSREKMRRLYERRRAT